MEAAESSLFPGYRLDRYELLCPIASGGMASVWLARLRGKRGFEKLFAIKTIKTELISDQHYQQMFLDEARIASQIVHPNVAQILELGEENEILYLVMEWVDGDSLAKVQRLCAKAGTPLPVHLSLRIVSDICAGLHAAHQLKDPSGEHLGVVHRDVSPQNVLLSSDGNAKVIDFGLVKAKGRTSAETESGIVKGKIRYMAPEQVGGKSASIDHRADVWAAGMCLLELVTSKQPYDHLDDLDVVKYLITPDSPPPIPDDVPPVVKALLSKALVRDKEGRFASCAVMKRAIDAALVELGHAVDPEDIAQFVRDKLPDLGGKRQRTIARAIEQADTRNFEGGSSVPVSAPSSRSSLVSESGEIGFAVTEVSARHSAESAANANFDDAVPLTRKVRTDQLQSDPEKSISDIGSATSTGGTSLREQLNDSSKKKSGVGFWIAAGVVAIAAAWILWPRHGGKPTTPEPAASAAPSASATPAQVTPPASASSVLELEATPVASAAPDAGAKRLPWPSGKPPPTTSAAPKADVDAGAGTKKINPAWSILTHPPSENATGDTPAPPPPPPPPPPPEPKPAE